MKNIFLIFFSILSITIFNIQAQTLIINNNTGVEINLSWLKDDIPLQITKNLKTNENVIAYPEDANGFGIFTSKVKELLQANKDKANCHKKLLTITGVQPKFVADRTYNVDLACDHNFGLIFKIS